MKFSRLEGTEEIMKIIRLPGTAERTKIIRLEETEERMKPIRLAGAVTETKFRWFLKIVMGQFREIMESRKINTNV